MPKDEDKKLESIEVTEEELKEQEGKFFMKDGQVFVRENEEEDEEEDDDKKTSDDEDEELEDEDLKGKGDDEDEDDEDDEDEDLTGTIYEGKSAAQIAQMHKQELKKTPSRSAPKGDDDKGKITKDATYYENELDKVEDKLDGMSKFDEGYDELKKQQRTLSRRYITENQREIIETNINAGKNMEFIEKKRKEYDDLEIDITPDEFDEVTNYAEKYMEKGKITDRSFTKGLIDKFGSEKVVKFFTIKGEKNARRKIKEAGAKVKPKVSTKSTKANVVKMRNISSMNPKQLDDYLESLSPAELADLYNKQTRK